MRSTILMLSSALTLALVLAPAGADEPDSAPTSIDDFDASAADGVLSATGSVTWGGQAPVIVGEDWGRNPPVPQGNVGHTAGIDLMNIYISQPDGNVDELEFVWEMSELNAPAPNEVVRYLWQMRVDGEVYWLQAKSSDLTTATMLPDDPAGTVTRLQGSFRLRGDCGPMDLPDQSPTGVNTCVHVAWLDGEFDLDANQVRVRVPLDLTAAEHFTSGSVITNEATGAEAGFQVVISNDTTTKQLAMEWDYTIPSKTVDLVLVDGDIAVASGPATVDGGAFAGELDVAGLPAGSYTLIATACFAGGCDVASVEVAL